jgi:hypothetical protein
VGLRARPEAVKRRQARYKLALHGGAFPKRRMLANVGVKRSWGFASLMGVPFVHGVVSAKGAAPCMRVVFKKARVGYDDALRAGAGTLMRPGSWAAATPADKLPSFRNR